MFRQVLRYRCMHAESTEILFVEFTYILEQYFETCLWNPGTYRHKIVLLSSARFGLILQKRLEKSNKQTKRSFFFEILHPPPPKENPRSAPAGKRQREEVIKFSSFLNFISVPVSHTTFFHLAQWCEYVSEKNSGVPVLTMPNFSKIGPKKLTVRKF